MPCPYANMLGVPGQGVHAWRVFGIAAFDVLATIVLAFLTSIIFSTPFFMTLVVWLIVGEILHYLFGTQTAVLSFLHVDARCHDDQK